jgi:hypothetical protein
MPRLGFLLLLLLLHTCGVAAAFGVGGSRGRIRTVVRTPRMVADDDSVPVDATEEDEAFPLPPTAASPNDSSNSQRYDVSKLVGGASDDEEAVGFNQFDPVLSATGFLSRRFGIVGGLAIFAALAAVEGQEILSALSGGDTTAGSGATLTTSSGLKITELLVGKGGSVPLPGYVIGIRAVVSIGDKVIYDTAGDKPIAFKYGQRPFQSVLCEGVEEGIQGMKVGGKRVLDVPSNLAPPGVVLPPGVPLIYEVELTEVLSGYF